MPYASIDELPASVKKLSKEAQHTFLRTFNSVYAEEGKESKAFAIAWTQAKKVDIKKALDGINYYIIGKNDMDSATLNNCPPGKHSHSTYANGKCHDMTIMHNANRKMDNRIKPLNKLKSLKPAKGREEIATEGQMNDEFIRKARMELAKLYKDEKDKNLAKLYYHMTLQANELLKEESVDNWATLYKMLESAEKQFPDVKVLHDLFDEIMNVEVEV
jgi:cation transport regulator ChaB